MPVLVVVLALVGVVVAVVWLGQRALIYVPDRSPAGSAELVLPGARDVTLTTSDGLTLGAWHLPPTGPCDATVLVAPGNGGNRAGRAGLARAVHERGFGVLLLDYRGYGGNPGRPSEVGLARDVRAARTYLLDAGVAPGQLVYLGESLGAGVVVELAVEHPPAAMVLRSPMTSLADVGRAVYGVPVGWLLQDHFRVVEHVARAGPPLTVVYGSDDGLVPPEQSREVARVAREARTEVVEVEVPGAGHNDAVLAQGPGLVAALVEVSRAAGITGCG
ncbi:alpha/beta hydrolase [Cellulomonas fimi]|uniref:Alpha/beta hydrolase n=2 Tax=Cellulomonas fimi TaxID=1708 RepID=A0A7Y0LUX0_CELFI|nr:alpha/beta hydrolase [Cellulomonas fimi]